MNPVCEAREARAPDPLVSLRSERNTCKTPGDMTTTWTGKFVDMPVNLHVEPCACLSGLGAVENFCRSQGMAL